MQCLKCGRDVDEDQVFCEDCLEEAAQYPVDPNAAVYLPPLKAQEVPVKPVRRRPPTPEEQLKGAKKRIRGLAIGLTLCILLLLAAAYPVYRYFAQEELLPGQNYTPLVTIPTASSEPVESSD